MTIAANPLARLRPFPSPVPLDSLACDSHTLIETDVPASFLPRTHFLSPESTSSTPPPVIARSPFVPDALVEHLMRNKRDSAITTKYLSGTAITNGEAAMHSFVTALVLATQCGDYAWRGGHTAVELGTSARGRRLGRRVVVSTALHNDFEDSQVAELFFALGDELVGRDLRLRQGGQRFIVPSVAEKNKPVFRRAYDERLRQHAVYHLLPDRRLPPRDELQHWPWTVDGTIARLVLHLQITWSYARETPIALLAGRSVRLSAPSTSILSLPLLLATHIASLANELSALEALTGPEGYVYTFQPPSIFARRLPAELSLLLVICALREIVLASAQPEAAVKLARLRAFALSTHSPALSSLFPLLRLSLVAHIPALALSSLFPAPSQTYAPPASLARATLVIHNNSDAFGQNIESEQSGGSVDGVVGAWGDASRGLRRDRSDLLAFVG